MRSTFCLRTIAILLLVGAIPNSIWAFDWVNWIQPAGGEFLNSSNWGGVDPESVTDGCLRFDLGQSPAYNVTLSREASVPSILVDNDRVNFDLHGHTLTTSDNFRTSLYVGVWEGDYGELTLTNGTLSAIGAGVAASWPNCTGLLRIDEGAILSLRDYAELVVGAGDDSSTTAFTSQGSLTICNGGQVLDEGTSNYSPMGIWIGGDPGAGGHGTGIVSVDGDGSKLYTRGPIYLGTTYRGKGYLTVSNGGLVQTDQTVFVGDYFYNSTNCVGQATVTGSNSRLLASEVFVGGGQSTLDILDGGSVSDIHGWIACESGTTGTATIRGVGSTWINSGYITVANEGSGTLNIVEGGAVRSNFGTIGDKTGSSGFVSVSGNGSTWTNDNELYVGESGSGTLDITDGGLVVVAGTLTIDGNADGDSFINMTSGGMLAIYGDANDSLEDFLGLAEGTDAIRYWDDSDSNWADITDATYGEDYTLGYIVGGCLDGYTLLCVGAPEPEMSGDANCDGAADAEDAAVLSLYWQTKDGAVLGMGDFNGDGAVDDVDATLLAANWLNGANGSVPEPGGLTLLVCGTVVLLTWRLRR